MTTNLRIRTCALQLLGILFIASLIFSFAQPVVAQSTAGLPDSYTLLEPLPCIPSEGITCAPGELKKTVNFKEYVQYMFNLFIAIAAVSAVFMIVWGGFQYMTSDAFNDKNEGLKKAKNAILGLLLVLCSFLILQTIDPRLVQISDTFVPQLKLTYNRNIYNTLFDRLSSSADQIRDNSARARAEILAAESRAAQFEQEKQTLQEQMAQAQQRGDTELVARLETQISDVQDRINDQKILAITTMGVGLINNFAVLQVHKDSLEAVDQDFVNLDRAYLKAVAELKAVSNPPDELAMKALREAKSKAFANIRDRRNILMNKK
jgi:hypothetical protein